MSGGRQADRQVSAGSLEGTSIYIRQRLARAPQYASDRGQMGLRVSWLLPRLAAQLHTASLLGPMASLSVVCAVRGRGSPRPGPSGLLMVTVGPA